jgi:hypothetical protein
MVISVNILVYMESLGTRPMRHVHYSVKRHGA